MIDKITKWLIDHDIDPAEMYWAGMIVLAVVIFVTIVVAGLNRSL